LKAISPIIVLLLLLAFVPPRVCAQGSTSNKGTEFWTCWMNHTDGTGSAMSLYIASDVVATGSVDFADGSTSIPFKTTPNQVIPIDIPTSVYLNAAGQVAKGIHITSDKNIVVYAHIYHASRSGATLVLPVNALGKDYYSINYTQKPITAFSVFCVIATENATTIEITPTAKLTTGELANVKFTKTLQKGEIYQALSSTDLTGTHIKSISSGAQPCKKIAVYSGSSFMAINCNTATGARNSADNLFQQAYPTATWGKNYITAPLSGRNYDIFRIICSDASAVVTLNGAVIPANKLINNLYYEINSQATNVITSDKPIQVAQYAVTQGATINCVDNGEAIGDPEMIFLSPIEQGLDHVSLYSTKQQNIVQSYINVIIPSSAASSFVLDGIPYTNFTAIPNTTYSYAQINVSSAATHNISASLPFNAIAYGFGSFESYGYSAGTDLKNLNEFIELKNPSTNTTASSGCVNITYKPQVNIPYTTSKITWDLKDGNPPLVVNNTAPKTTVVKNGQTLYVYEYPSTVTYTTPNNYTIIATVFNANADDCGSDEVVEFDYSISDIPGATFTASSLNICPGAEVNFTDQTDTKGVYTKTWAWDFGDRANSTTANPNTATIQNPKHVYTKPGDYTVTLTVVNENGCSSTYTLTQPIHVNVQPVAAFAASTPDCETRDVTFDAATSTPGEGTFSALSWDFGDNSALVIKTTTTPFTHQFATAGTYTVSLTITSSTGCVSDIKTQTIVVHPLPEVDFILPDACPTDAALFTNTTKITDGSDTQIQYNWDFGDSHSTPANNVSTLTSPKHQFTVPGVYTVTLTAKSKDGCVIVKSQSLTINGANPTPAFKIQNPNNAVCGSDDALFQNQSNVSFGNITKIEWYFDYNNDKTNPTTILKADFPADGVFHHKYQLFNTPGQKTYAVVMRVYSGESCFNITAPQNITVYANPLVTVSPISPLCQEAPAEQIPITVNYGTGSGIFSGGSYVTPGGLFDPGKSGPGKFTVNYTYTSSTAGVCIYSTSLDVIVNPTPKVDGGGDLRILQGGNITINATASGNEPLTYKWTMADGGKAVGLDHDDVLKPIASPVDDVSYMLTVTTADGCTKSSIVNIAVLKAPEIPTAFTPNHDGINDTWEIKYLDTYPNCTVEVYNRYGEKLYSSIGYPIAWDGTFKGADLPVGTYYYIINPKNGRKVITGSITIIR
jgi:gliding motility-associated-like protein